MDSPENPWETLPVEVNPEIANLETPEISEPDPREIMDLIFPEGRPILVKVYAYISCDPGKPVIRFITGRTTPEFKAAGLQELEIRSSWTVPTASQMDLYREECSEYNRQAQSMVCNNLAIRDLIVMNHLKGLFFPPLYTPFHLQYARPDRLSRETVGRIKDMHSGIYDRLYTEFVSESCLIV